MLSMMIVVVVGALLVPADPVRAASDEETGVETISFPWQEPRGINAVDLVGLVPEAHLQDAIMAFSYHGILRYLAGERVGDQVTVDVSVVPQYQTDDSGPKTSFNCIGQWAVFDQWPAPVAASEMRVFEDGVDVTSEVELMLHFPARQGIPTGNTTWTRYPEIFWRAVEFAENGALLIPANMGCFLFMSGHRENLTARFVLSDPPQFSVQPLGQQSFVAHSYIGPGAAGHVESLRQQMQARFAGIRHDKFRLSPPAGAEFLLVSYPPTPFSPYAGGDVDTNVRLPSSGTYRLARGSGDLAVDHTVSMALPLYQQWRDADNSPDHEYLPRVRGVNTLASPEYFVLPGIAYHPCMTNGGCPDSLLDAIYASEMTITVYYYAIKRTVVGLDRIPLRQVGPDYALSTVRQTDVTALTTYPAAIARSGGAPESAPDERQPADAGSQIPAPADEEAFVLFLPLITNFQDPYVVQPDDPTDCPCGWFDRYGRMVDVIAE